MTTPEAQGNPAVEALDLDTITPEIVEDFQRLSPQLTGKEPLSTEVVKTRLRNAVDNPNARVLVVRADGRVQATAMALIDNLSIAGPKAWVEDVVTDQGYQGKGFASLLMNGLEGWAAERGVTSINLTSNPARESARRMYEKRGYFLRDTGVFRKMLNET